MASIFLTIFLSSFILLLSSSDATSTWSSNIIDEICNASARHWNKPFCIDTLKSDMRIISATTLDSLATGIIESGLTNVTNTHGFLINMIRKGDVKSLHKKALNECIEFYYGAINSFDSALLEVKEDKEYMTASYDVLIAVENVDNCDKALLSHKVDNAPTIFSGNKFAMYFGNTADTVLTRLMVNSPPNHKI